MTNHLGYNVDCVIKSIAWKKLGGIDIHFLLKFMFLLCPSKYNTIFSMTKEYNFYDDYLSVHQPYSIYDMSFLFSQNHRSP